MSDESFPKPSQTDQLQWIDDYSKSRLESIAEQETRGEVVSDITPESALEAVIPHLEFKLDVLARSLSKGRIPQELYERLAEDVQAQLTAFRIMDPGTSYFDALRIFHDYEVAEMRRNVMGKHK